MGASPKSTGSPVSSNKVSLPDITTMPPDVLSAMLAFHGWLASSFAKIASQPSIPAVAQVPVDPTPCLCPGDCDGLVGLCVQTCNGETPTVVLPPNPNANSTLAWDALSKTIYWKAD